MEFAKPLLAAFVALMLIGTPEQGAKPAGTTGAANVSFQRRSPGAG